MDTPTVRIVFVTKLIIKGIGMSSSSLRENIIKFACCGFRGWPELMKQQIIDKLTESYFRIGGKFRICGVRFILLWALSDLLILAMGRTVVTHFHKLRRGNINYDVAFKNILVVRLATLCRVQVKP